MTKPQMFVDRQTTISRVAAADADLGSGTEVGAEPTKPLSPAYRGPAAAKLKLLAVMQVNVAAAL
jgi:hypothetical protein